jgi:hypothetical protein
MFAKLAQKYNVSNPLDEVGQVNKEGGSTLASKQETSLGFGTLGTSPFGGSGVSGSDNNTTSQVMEQSMEQSAPPFVSAPSPVFASSPFGTATTSAPTFGSPSLGASPFGSTPFSTVPNEASTVPPFGSSAGASAPNLGEATFGGKTARELLTQFYQEKNPSKIAEVEKLLIKYQVCGIARD